MSLTTTATFYSTDHSLIAGSYVLECLAVIGVVLTGGVGRSPVSGSAWEALKKGVDLEPKMEWCGESLANEAVSRLVSEHYLLTVGFGVPEILRTVHSAVLTSIPQAIIGEHSPNAMSLDVGWHDIYDDVEDEDGHFYARSSFSVSFSGPQIPADLDKYRVSFFKLEEVLSVKNQFEKVLGPLESCLVINV